MKNDKVGSGDTLIFGNTEMRLYIYLRPTPKDRMSNLTQTKQLRGCRETEAETERGRERGRHWEELRVTCTTPTHTRSIL